MSTVTAYSHCPVMVEEVLSHLLPRSGGIYCDATLGGGGHAERLLLASAPDGRVLGIDRDPQALAAATARLSGFGERFVPIHGRFGDLPELLLSHGVRAVDGILADVGLSSAQIDQAERGFSFRQAGPIDMRMDPSSGETAGALIARLHEAELADILHVYGEERHARRIARAIRRAAAAGELSDTLGLARLIGSLGLPREPGQDPATRTFQALRIAVNDELRELDRLLRAAPGCLLPGGRLVLISFHSLEDRIVKQRLRGLSQPGGVQGMAPDLIGMIGMIDPAGPQAPQLCLLTRKPICPGPAEIEGNPRSRSARLRAALRPRPAGPGGPA